VNENSGGGSQTMMRQLLLTLLIFTVFLVGCSKRPQPTYKGPEPPFEFVKTLSNARTIAEVYHQIKVINLRTPDTIFIGDIRNIHVNKLGQIAIIDRANRTPVVFDSSGNFLFFLGKYGAGPGECRGASAVSYNEGRKQWIVADGVSLGVLLFDDSGKFLSSFRVPSFVSKIYSDESGHLYLFMPTRRMDCLVEARDYTGRLIKCFSPPNTLLKRLPFELKGGSICSDNRRVFVTHYIGSSIEAFDNTGQLDSEFPLKGLADYLPPDESRIFESPRKFISSFTGVTGLFIAPYDMLVVQYSQMQFSNEGARSTYKVPLTWLAFFRQDGTLLGQGIRSPVGFYVSDSHGRLYSMLEPSSVNENTRIVIWALKHFQ